MDKFSALMQKRVGGIPVSVIALVLGAVILYMAFRMKASPAVEDSEATAETIDEEVAAVEGDGDTVPQFRSNVTYMTAGTTTVTNVTDTNEAWGRRAKEFLIGSGISIDLATRSVEKYLAGEELNSEEVRVRDRAVTQFGLPPEEFTYGGTVNPSEDPTIPAPTPQPSGGTSVAPVKQGTPPCVHTIKGPNDNNATDLARLYYGTTNKDLRDLIANANTSHGDPPWRPGTRVRIPRKASTTTTPGKGSPKFFVTTTKVRGATEIAAKNGTTRARVVALNPNKEFPVGAGVRVRVS